MLPINDTVEVECFKAGVMADPVCMGPRGPSPALSRSCARWVNSWDGALVPLVGRTMPIATARRQCERPGSSRPKTRAGRLPELREVRRIGKERRPAEIGE